jgi:hypothetical protein
VTWRDARARDSFNVVAKYYTKRPLWKSSIFLLTTPAGKFKTVAAMRKHPQPVTGYSQDIHSFSTEGVICTQ